MLKAKIIKIITLAKKNGIRILENSLKGFVSFHLRPKTAAQVNTWSEELFNSPRFGMVIQGPITKDNDFTLETIKIYLKHFNNTVIILSTWDDEDPAYLERFKGLPIEIILNKKPAYAGYSHINYQLTSAYNGLKRAKELDCAYAMKTRTDVRIYAPNVKAFLINLLEAFPVKGNWAQNKRLIGVNFNTYKFRPYGLSDVTIFGQIDDMLMYWGADLDMRPVIKDVPNTCWAFYQLRVCEMYLVTEFLKKLNRPIKWTIQDSWAAYRDHFCVVDESSIDFYFYKYIRWREYRRLAYDGIKNCQIMNFLDWLNIYQGLNNKADIPEKAMDKPFDGQVRD